MKVTYIHHSSFMAELEHAALLFDYFEGEIPAVEGDKPLFVFASHRHGDHFSRAIFDLADQRRNVTYILSDDIWRRQVPEELLEGKAIYHAGDLNNWVWEGEPEKDNQKMSERYHGELAKLAGRHIDVAFMLIDPRQEKDFYLGMDDFMRMVGADVVFPMHFWGDFEAAARFKALPCAKDYQDRIREIHRTGECFIV